MQTKKIIRINTLLFFVGWLVILLLGADFPPPLGFLWLVPLLIALDLIQHRYLQFFLPQLHRREKNLFLKNICFFAGSGIAVALFCLAIRYEISATMGLLNIGVWIGVLAAVAAGYAIFFWFFNLLLFKQFR